MIMFILEVMKYRLIVGKDLQVYYKFTRFSTYTSLMKLYLIIAKISTVVNMKLGVKGLGPRLVLSVIIWVGTGLPPP